nr:hypothetical protein [Pseudopedobacter sp.]
MPKINVSLTEENISEWIHSVGYFLPRNDKEDDRFEKLNADITYDLDAINSVDPFAILSGSWKPQLVLKLGNVQLSEEVSVLKMAARKHEDIPEEIFKKMKRNQENNDPNNPES